MMSRVSPVVKLLILYKDLCNEWVRERCVSAFRHYRLEMSMPLSHKKLYELVSFHHETLVPPYSVDVNVF